MISRVNNRLKNFVKSYSPFHGYKKEYGKDVFPYPAPDTNFQFHGKGLGDLMIIRQFGSAINDYYKNVNDPELGKVVIAAGGMESAFHPDPGDINLYWWWSFGGFDDSPEQYLEYYLDQTSVEPDIILCLSNQCMKEAEQMGYETVYFPLGVYSFEPLNFRREGLGYAGSKSHKSPDKQARLLGEFMQDDDFEWVSHFEQPEQLNQWYNQKLITFGLHKEGQRQWGMVNNRVFETLASGTPLILERHPTISNVLGFEYPYQSSSPAETRQLVETIEQNPQEVLEEFQRYSEQVRRNHSYAKRIRKLIKILS